MKNLLILSLAAVSTGAFAQSANSFQAVTFEGLTATEPLSYNLNISLSSGAKVTLNGVQYTIKDVFGVFRFTKTGTISQAASSLAPTSWKFDGVQNKNTNTIGWTNNNKSNSLSPGESFDFKLGSFAATGAVLTGYHVRVNGNLAGGGDTFFAYGPTVPAPVPEPATIAVLGLGAAALLRRKKAAK